ncbi:MULTISPECIES: hypothetical protein [unclassified Myroides]|uniref:hypothetical protein n=1 Tax=unclassified Myroides TaxID=2642485 RepID=UPI00310104D5
MKKLIMCLFVAGLTVLGTSCSSDDNTKEVVLVEQALEVQATKTNVVRGESVRFMITFNGERESQAELFIGDQQIYTPHQFNKAGVYEVIAKKAGVKTSNPIIITVEKAAGEQDEIKTLAITANYTSVEVGDVVKFFVTDGEKQVADAIIKDADGKVVTNGTWTTTKEGTFKFTASKEGYNNSTEIEINVVAKKAPAEFFIEINGVAHEIDPNSVRMLVESETVDGVKKPKIFSVKAGFTTLYYANFVISATTTDFGRVNGEAQGAMLRITKRVLQDIKLPLQLPGENPERELNIGGWVSKNVQFYDIKDSHFKTFDTKLKGFNDGGETKILIEAPGIKINYNGSFRSMDFTAPSK